MTTNSSEPLKLFYCYAHEDKTLRDELDTHLSGMKRQNLIKVWYDREILAGTDWEQEINTHLSTAHIILLLVSARFLASDYCYGIEMQKALQRDKAGTARVVPILLRPVDWEDAPFSHLQILPTGAKPVTRWTDHNDAFEDIARGLRKVVKQLQVSSKTKEEWLEEGNKNLKQYQKALAAYDHAIQLDPHYIIAYNNKGYVLNELERFDEALVALNKAIQFDPNFANAYRNKGYALNKLERYEEALVAYDHAIRLDSNFAAAYYNKGIMLQKLNRTNEAQAAFAKAKQLGYPG